MPERADAACAPPSPHPDVARLARQFREQGVPRYDRIGVLKARAILQNVVGLQSPAVAVAQVSDILVPGGSGLLPVRIYHPAPDAELPLVVYLHGGGWSLGDVRVADRPCRRLALQSSCAVASVEYRRAPESRFPAGLEDCLAAVRWLADNAAALRCDPQRLVLLGDSAGGNLAAAVALCLRDDGGPPLAAQILLYPCLFPARNSPFASYAEHAEGPLITRAELEWFWSLYLASEQQESDPRAAPLAAPRLSGLPPTAIFVAELDPLRDEGLAYAQRLRDCGVHVSTRIYEGAAHGFWWMDAELRQAHELTAELAALLGQL